METKSHIQDIIHAKETVRPQASEIDGLLAEDFLRFSSAVR